MKIWQFYKMEVGKAIYEKTVYVLILKDQKEERRSNLNTKNK